MRAPDPGSVLRVSKAAAIQIGLVRGRFFRDSAPACINLLQDLPGGCRASCGYCGLSRDRDRKEGDTFIRVKWPTADEVTIAGHIEASHDRIERICIATVIHPEAKTDLLRRLDWLSKYDIPLSALVSSVQVDHDSAREMRERGARILGIGMDAASARVMARTRGGALGGWDMHWRAIETAVDVFGGGNVNIHIVVGLGETDAELVETAVRLYDIGAGCFLFSFCPEAGTSMAGNPPDMVIYHAAEVKQMTAQGLVQPMDDCYTAIGIGKDQFNKVLIDQITVDGKTMTVPFDNHGWLNWVNEKVISDAGLDPKALPKNGTEFIPWAQKITKDKNGKHPTESGFDKDNVAVWAIYWTWLRYTVPASLWQFGGAVISDDGKTALLGSPQSIAAIQYWHDLMYKYYVCPPGLPGLAYGGEMYQANGIALWWEGTWTGGYMRDRPEVAAVTRPDFINSLAPDGKQAMKFDSHVFSIPVGVPEENKAKLYPMIKYLLENGAYWATSGQVPALKSVQASAEVQKIKSVAKAAEQFNAIGRTDMVHKAFVEIQTAYETAVSAAVASADTDVAKALKDGNAVIQAILDRP